jgi:hypothetical protein
MLTRKTILGVAAALIVALLLVGQSLSQPGQRGGQRGQRGGVQGPTQGGQRPGFQGGQFDPERMRQMLEQRVQQQLGATDQEWKVLGPRVMKVQELSRQTGGGGRGGMMFGGGMFGGGRRGGPEGDRPGARQGAPARELTDVEKAMEQLRNLLEDTSATPEKIKNALTALRGAREKAKRELAVSQQELRKIVTVRQEGQLVYMGLLD